MVKSEERPRAASSDCTHRDLDWLLGLNMHECYASALGDCEGRLSKEHYFSAGVLRQLFQTGEYKVGGFHWQKSGYQPPSIPSLSANILCEKHNRQLSPLDEEALRIVLFFDNHVSIVAQGLHHTKSIFLLYFQ